MATFTVADTKAQIVTYTAKDTTDTITITQTATVTFTVGAVSASLSTVVANPTSVVANGTASTITVTLLDANSNPVSGKTVTLAQTSGSGTPTITIVSGTTNSSGQATFTVSSTTASANIFTATDTTDSITITQTATVTFTPGAATKLAFTTQPAGGMAGTPFPSQPIVAVEDANGNTVTTSTASIKLVIGTNPSSGTLTINTNPLSAANGVATFSGVSINNNGNGYTLTASSSGLTGATSNLFNITGPATQLVFTTQPSGGTGGTAFGTQPVVTVEDADGNKVTTSSASITLAITSGTGTSGATLSATTNPLAASSGVATFSGVSINMAGTGYTLTATSSGLTPATSSPFTITVGPAAQLAFTTQPSGGTGGTAFGTQPVVTVEDAGGNKVTTSTASITLAITFIPVPAEPLYRLPLIPWAPRVVWRLSAGLA